ncbi:conserved exported protein of unknown function [Hyphomicrobium sp. 1Nfss2.1]|uniref:hypothetical protein n=1 Tax=Hyphomicrobium sp. 1Nfss2.1 TaxID=3413936 RepID=UPI003C7B4A60
MTTRLNSARALLLSIPSFFLTACVTWCGTVNATATTAISDCVSIRDDAGRLACFDREARKLVEPRFSGRLSKITEPFSIRQPTLLRYQSDGPIFVLYLKAADGAVVQNLHIGGGGEATYRIEQPGTYFLDVNGSESWRIWLEPEATSKAN